MLTSGKLVLQESLNDIDTGPSGRPHILRFLSGSRTYTGAVVVPRKRGRGVDGGGWGPLLQPGLAQVGGRLL